MKSARDTDGYNQDRMAAMRSSMPQGYGRPLVHDGPKGKIEYSSGVDYTFDLPAGALLTS